MGERMVDLAKQGALSFDVGHEHPDWATNDTQYNFHLPEAPGVTVDAFKRSDGTFEVILKNTSGGFQATLSVPMPKPAEPSSTQPYTFLARVGWAAGGAEINLFLNDELVASTKGEPLT